ncbi:serine-rich adhesin for platelets-like isoform X2 [Penaeus japonicus]|uniref:serine-rich adhesin for platelets-like isoform X2 n=1 Tax=Penaeus japonicus TaxID=27405 RepID=UPI001C710171|nr:serine-rich adhesin for platelets-like isoform X2 [Penaeus japonicus]
MPLLQELKHEVFQCNKCAALFTCKHFWKKHFTQACPLRYSCIVCNITFTGKCLLQTHVIKYNHTALAFSKYAVPDEIYKELEQGGKINTGSAVSPGVTTRLAILTGPVGGARRDVQSSRIPLDGSQDKTREGSEGGGGCGENRGKEGVMQRSRDEGDVQTCSDGNVQTLCNGGGLLRECTSGDVQILRNEGDVQNISSEGDVKMCSDVQKICSESNVKTGSGGNMEKVCNEGDVQTCNDGNVQAHNVLDVQNMCNKGSTPSSDQKLGEDKDKLDCDVRQCSKDKNADLVSDVSKEFPSLESDPSRPRDVKSPLRDTHEKSDATEKSDSSHHSNETFPLKCTYKEISSMDKSDSSGHMNAVLLHKNTYGKISAMDKSVISNCLPHFTVKLPHKDSLSLNAIAKIFDDDKDDSSHSNVMLPLNDCSSSNDKKRETMSKTVTTGMLERQKRPTVSINVGVKSQKVTRAVNQNITNNSTPVTKFAAVYDETAMVSGVSSGNRENSCNNIGAKNGNKEMTRETKSATTLSEIAKAPLPAFQAFSQHKTLGKTKSTLDKKARAFKINIKAMSKQLIEGRASTKTTIKSSGGVKDDKVSSKIWNEVDTKPLSKASTEVENHKENTESNKSRICFTLREKPFQKPLQLPVRQEEDNLEKSDLEYLKDPKKSQLYELRNEIEQEKELEAEIERALKEFSESHIFSKNRRASRDRRSKKMSKANSVEDESQTDSSSTSSCEHLGDQIIRPKTDKKSKSVELGVKVGSKRISTPTSKDACTCKEEHEDKRISRDTENGKSYSGTQKHSLKNCTSCIMDSIKRDILQTHFDLKVGGNKDDIGRNHFEKCVDSCLNGAHNQDHQAKDTVSQKNKCSSLLERIQGNEKLRKAYETTQAEQDKRELIKKHQLSSTSDSELLDSTENDLESHHPCTLVNYSPSNESLNRTSSTDNILSGDEIRRNKYRSRSRVRSKHNQSRSRHPSKNSSSLSSDRLRKSKSKSRERNKGNRTRPRGLRSNSRPSSSSRGRESRSRSRYKSSDSWSRSRSKNRRTHSWSRHRNRETRSRSRHRNRETRSRSRHRNRETRSRSRHRNRETRSRSRYSSRGTRFRSRSWSIERCAWLRFGCRRSRSRSRSRSRGTCSRSRYRSRETRSRSRLRSRRTRSRSRYRSRETRSRSRLRIRRTRSRSRYRSRETRSRSRLRSRRTRSRSRLRNRRTRSRSRLTSRRTRSWSRLTSRRTRSRSRSRTTRPCSKSRDRSRESQFRSRHRSRETCSRSIHRSRRTRSRSRSRTRGTHSRSRHRSKDSNSSSSSSSKDRETVKHFKSASKAQEDPAYKSKHSRSRSRDRSRAGSHSRSSPTSISDPSSLNDEIIAKKNQERKKERDLKCKKRKKKSIRKEVESLKKKECDSVKTEINQDEYISSKQIKSNTDNDENYKMSKMITISSDSSDESQRTKEKKRKRKRKKMRKSPIKLEKDKEQKEKHLEKTSLSSPDTSKSKTIHPIASAVPNCQPCRSASEQTDESMKDTYDSCNNQYSHRNYMPVGSVQMENLSDSEDITRQDSEDGDQLKNLVLDRIYRRHITEPSVLPNVARTVSEKESNKVSISGQTDRSRRSTNACIMQEDSHGHKGKSLQYSESEDGLTESQKPANSNDGSDSGVTSSVDFSERECDLGLVQSCQVDSSTSEAEKSDFKANNSKEDRGVDKESADVSLGHDVAKDKGKSSQRVTRRRSSTQLDHLDNDTVTSSAKLHDDSESNHSQNLDGDTLSPQDVGDSDSAESFLLFEVGDEQIGKQINGESIFEGDQDSASNSGGEMSENDPLNDTKTTEEIQCNLVTSEKIEISEHPRLDNSHQKPSIVENVADLVKRRKRVTRTPDIFSYLEPTKSLKCSTPQSSKYSSETDTPDTSSSLSQSSKTSKSKSRKVKSRSMGPMKCVENNIIDYMTNTCPECQSALVLDEFTSVNLRTGDITMKCQKCLMYTFMMGVLVLNTGKITKNQSVKDSEYSVKLSTDKKQSGKDTEINLETKDRLTKLKGEKMSPSSDKSHNNNSNKDWETTQNKENGSHEEKPENNKGRRRRTKKAVWEDSQSGESCLSETTSEEGAAKKKSDWKEKDGGSVKRSHRHTGEGD